MQKILHFSDTHLGYTNYDYVNSAGVNVREQDFYDAFEQVINAILTQKPDLVLHTGDLFHRASPSNRAITFVFEQLSRVSAAGVRMVIIAGNHSTPRTPFTSPILQAYSTLPHIFVVCNQRYETHIFDNIVIHGLPHINDETTQKTELQRIETIENKCNILMLHTSLGKDYMMTEFGEKMFPEEKYALLNQFDYIALGHWHNFQQVKGIKNAWYSGSTERLSDSEVRHEKGYCYITINDDNTASTPEFVGLNSRKWLKMLVKNCFEKSIDDILSEIKNLADDADVQDAIVGLMLENLTAPQSFNLKNTDIKAMFDGVFHLEIKRTRYQAASSDYSELNTENLADIADSFGGFVAGKYTDADQERTKAIIEIFTHYYNKNKTD